MPTAILVIVVVAVLVGAGGYVGFNAVKPEVTNHNSCTPAASAACGAIATTHDIALLLPFASTQAGSSVPATALLPSGTTSSNFKFNFGDGSAAVAQTSSAATHVYQYPGVYIISVTATIGTVTHDNYQHLSVIHISQTSASTESANVPGLSGAITDNTTHPAQGATAIIGEGGYVAFSGTYTSAPTNPRFAVTSPSLQAPSGQVSNSKSSPTSVSAKVSYQAAGVYWVTFVGNASATVGGTTVTAHQNFVWTVFVAPAGVHAGTTGASTNASPHNGTLRVYELSPGGARSFDPSIEYDTVSGEVGLNLYQTLIQYNGSAAGPDPADFVPYLAACVPGSSQCSSLFPSSTQGAAAGTALTFPSVRGYTFVINSASQFYDHGTGNHWGVYPTDVMFSIIRTEAFTDQPFATANNGWLVAQALIDSPGSGIHSPYDNSLASSFARILVNSSAYCPSLALTSSNYHGCVTFLANGSGVNWPFFLELMADWAGAGIEPCGWYSAGAQGASLPGWTDTSAYTSSNGDHPCALPGGASSTDAAAYKSAITTMSTTPSTLTAWDTLQTLGSSPPYVGNVRWAVVSSGPYYLVNTLIGSTYTLGANPYYVANPSCDYAGCMPAAGKFAPNVQVIWESSATDGELAYRAGTADGATIPTTDTSILLQLEQQGKVQASQFPTISIYFWCFNMWFPVAAAQHFTTNKITVPSDFFSYPAVRQFFAHAFPYNSSAATINTVDGIPYYFNYGGAIPEFMGNYYPTNVTWPSGDPPSGSPAGSASWWWTQGTTPGSPFYDPEMAACSTTSPCSVPFIGQTGAPNIDQMSALLQSELSTLSGGKLKLILLDINFADLVNNAFGPPPNPMPFYQLGWAPDYPDPTDYIAPMYQTGAGYAGADAVGSQFALPPFNGATYAGGSCPLATDYVGYAHMAETMSGIPTSCQGRAFAAMNYAENIAGGYQSNATRVLLYNFIEQIANGLALYLHWGQQNAVLTTASWIDPNTPNVSVMIGGSSMQTWWSWGGTNVH